VSDPTSDTPSVLYQTPGTRTFWAIAPGNASINAAWTSGHDYQGISQPIAIDP
jgi:hypothetical protein